MTSFHIIRQYEGGPPSNPRSQGGYHRHPHGSSAAAATPRRAGAVVGVSFRAPPPPLSLFSHDRRCWSDGTFPATGARSGGGAAAAAALRMGWSWLGRSAYPCAPCRARTPVSETCPRVRARRGRISESACQYVRSSPASKNVCALSRSGGWGNPDEVAPERIEPRERARGKRDARR